jgi:hypothetical protein
MHESTFFEKIKDFIRLDIIAGLSWKVFLWSIGTTAEKYWTHVYHQERNRRCIDHREESERLGMKIENE